MAGGISDFLVQIVWECHDGKFDSLRRLVELSGGTVQEETVQGQRYLTVKAAHGMTCGLAAHDDPITTFVQVAFILFGPMWPSMPEVQWAGEFIAKQWSEQTRAIRRKGTRTQLGKQLSFLDGGE